MRSKVLFILCSILGATVFVSAQTKTITNADLEKYRQKRLAAERDYEENYERMGFPSPEELKWQNEESQRDLIEYSEQLRSERMENDNSFQADADALRSQIASVEAQINYLRGELNRNPNLGRIFLGGVGTNNSVFRTGTTINRAGLPNIVGSQRVLPNVVGTYNGNRRVVTNTPRLRRTGGIVGRGNIRIGNVGRRGYDRRYRRGGFYGRNVIAVPYLNSGYYQREEIASNLRALEQTRAGLLAQFRVLQEQANREGVRIY